MGKRKSNKLSTIIRYELICLAAVSVIVFGVVRWSEGRMNAAQAEAAGAPNAAPQGNQDITGKSVPFENTDGMDESGSKENPDKTGNSVPAGNQEGTGNQVPGMNQVPESNQAVTDIPDGDIKYPGTAGTPTPSADQAKQPGEDNIAAGQDASRYTSFDIHNFSRRCTAWICV